MYNRHLLRPLEKMGKGKIPDAGFPAGVWQHIGQNIGHFFKKYRRI